MILKVNPLRDTNNLKVDSIGTVKIPFYTSIVPAGFPDPEGHTQEEFLELDKRYVRNPETSFCIRVSGDSMIGAGIEPGALLVVDRAVLPSNGNIVLAVLNGEMTIKRFLKNDDQILLVPENPQYPSIKIKEEDNFAICGVVVQVVQAGEEFRTLTELINAKKPT